MSNTHQVDEAVGIARGLVGGEVPAGPPVLALTELARRFAAVEFDVPEDQDADGFLFQYGRANWFPEHIFVLNMVRQLEVVDSGGEHEFYSQVQFEYRYALDAELEAAGSHSGWWFPGDGPSFESWLDSVSRSPIGGLLGGRNPREFVVSEDQV